MEFEHKTEYVKVPKRVIEVNLYDLYILDKVMTLNGESLLLWDAEHSEWALAHRFLDYSEDGSAMLFEDCIEPFKTKDPREAMSKWLDYVEKWSK